MSEYDEVIWRVVRDVDIFGNDEVPEESRGPLESDEPPPIHETVINTVKLAWPFRRMQDENVTIKDKNKQVKQDEALIDKVAKALSSEDEVRVIELVTREFGKRFRNALKIALPHLEGVFFYEFDKFRVVYDDVINRLKQQHGLHIIDPGSDIKDRLLGDQQNAKLAKITDAIRVLAKLPVLRNNSY